MPQFKFKLCPFCGGEEIRIHHIKRVVKEADTWRVECVSCGVHSEENSYQKAVEFWNKRFFDINRKEKSARVATPSFVDKRRRLRKRLTRTINRC